MLELDKIHCGDNCDLLGQLLPANPAGGPQQTGLALEP